MPAPHITPEQLLQHQDWLFRLVRNLVKDDFTADDMVQATMVEALASEDAGKTNLRAWLSSTARRLTAQHWRSSYRRQQREDKVGIADEAVLEQSSDLTDLFNVANQALGELPESERVVIMLRHMQGWKSERVASELEIPVEQVYRDSERGFKKLRDRLSLKYGKEWKASCLAIIGIPLGRSTAATFAGAAMGVAASIALVAAGLWAGGFFQSKPLSERGAELALNQTPGSQNSVAPVSNLPQGMERTVLPPPIPMETGYPILVVDHEGDAVLNAKVTAVFEDRAWFLPSGRRNYSTDSAGKANLNLPEDHDLGAVMIKANGLFFQPEEEWNFTRGVPIQVQLTKGTIPASFQLSPAREGINLEIRSDQNFHGLCTTDSDGFTEILLPHAGKYTVDASPSPRFSTTVNFQSFAGGSQRPVVIPYTNPRSISLQAIDSAYETPILNAQFILHWRTRDENHIHSGYQEESLDAEEGLLEQFRAIDAPAQYHIRVQAEGYLDCIVSYAGESAEAWEVPMQQQEWVRASLQMEASRNLVFAEKVRQVPSHEFGVPPEKSPLGKWRDHTPQPLEILSSQTVLFPRVQDEEGLVFSIHAVDNLGDHWYSGALGAMDSKGGELTFPMTRREQDVTTFRLHNLPSPSLGNFYHLDRTPMPPGLEDRMVYPDENGVIKASTSVGNKWMLNFQNSNFSFGLSGKLASEGANPTIEVTFPPQNGSLRGTVKNGLGEPFPNTTAKLVPSAEIEVAGPGELKVWSRAFRVDVVEGVIDADNLFAGTYAISLSAAGETIEDTVTAGVDFALQAEQKAQLQFLMRDALSGELIAAKLMKIRPPHYPGRVAECDATSGSISAYVLMDGSPYKQMFLEAEGYESRLLTNIPFGSPQEVSMKAGQNLRLSYEELRIVAGTDTHWTLNEWGDEEDPRQQSIFHGAEFFKVDGAPLADCMLIERHADGSETGRKIEVLADGSTQVHSS